MAGWSRSLAPARWVVYEAMEGYVDREVSKPYDPAWSEEECLPGRSQDALGMENFGEFILGDLLPGINNQFLQGKPQKPPQAHGQHQPHCLQGLRGWIALHNLDLSY